MRIVISNAFGGGFYINDTLRRELERSTGGWIPQDDDYRVDPTVIEAVEKRWNGTSELTVAEIPDDTDYIITEYDGYETLYYIAYNEKGRPYIKEYED